MLTVAEVEHAAALLVAFDADPGAAALAADMWGLTGIGAPCLVAEVEALTGGLAFRLRLAPGLEPGAAYTLTDPAASAALVVLGPAVDTGFPAVSLLERLTVTAGAALDRTVGGPASRLLAAFDPLAALPVRLPVEGAIGFPDVGRVWVGDSLIRYTGIDPSGSALLLPVLLRAGLETANAGDLVVLAADSDTSQARRAFGATLVQDAAGGDLTTLARWYGLPRPGVVSEGAWRRALRAVVYAPRATPGSVVSFLRDAYSDLDDTRSAVVDLAWPHRIYPAPGEVWECGLTDRLVEVTFIPRGADVDPLLLERAPDLLPWRRAVVWSWGPKPAEKRGDLDWLDLAPYRSGRWSAANWSAGPLAIHPEHLDVTVRFLPFRWVEDAGTLRVQLGEIDATFPPSYLLEGGEDRGTTPPGALLLDEANVDGLSPPPPADGDPSRGLWPLYLGGDVIARIRESVRAVVAAGVRVEEEVVRWCL